MRQVNAAEGKSKHSLKSRQRVCGPPGGWRCRFQGCCEESLYPAQPVHQGTMPIAADAGISRLPHPGIDLPSDRAGASQVALVVKKKKKNPPANAGGIRDKCSIPGSGRSPGGGHAPLQYSCLENPMDRGAWWATVHEVTKSQTQLSN